MTTTPMTSQGIISVRLKESATGTSPAAGFLDVLAETDRNLHTYNSASSDTQIGTGTGAALGWTSVCVISGNYSVDAGDTAVFHHATALTASAIVTLPSPTELSIGDSFWICTGSGNEYALQVDVADSASEYLFNRSLNNSSCAHWTDGPIHQYSIFKYYGSGSWFVWEPISQAMNEGEFTSGGNGE